MVEVGVQAMEEFWLVGNSCWRYAASQGSSLFLLLEKRNALVVVVVMVVVIKKKRKSVDFIFCFTIFQYFWIFIKSLTLCVNFLT